MGKFLHRPPKLAGEFSQYPNANHYLGLTNDEFALHHWIFTNVTAFQPTYASIKKRFAVSNKTIDRWMDGLEKHRLAKRCYINRVTIWHVWLFPYESESVTIKPSVETDSQELEPSQEPSPVTPKQVTPQTIFSPETWIEANRKGQTNNEFMQRISKRLKACTDSEKDLKLAKRLHLVLERLREQPFDLESQRQLLFQSEEKRMDKSVQ